MNVRRWRELNWTMIGAVLALLLIGIAALHSATLNALAGNGAPLRPIFSRQLIYIGFGLLAMVATIMFDYRLLSSLARPIYLLAVGLLAVVLIIGQVSEGAQSWLLIGQRTFQPAELSKLALILALAAYWSRFEDRRDRWLIQFGALLITAPALVLVYIQPDLGTSIVIAAIWFVMAWGAGMRWNQLLTIAVIGSAVLSVGWVSLLDTYQQRRLSTFILILTDPSRVNYDEAYNVIQALNAIGAGGLTGAGLTLGLFSQGNYVPVQHTDFIFAVIGEELGFIGAMVLLLFLSVLLWQSLSIAERARDMFGRQIALGVFAMLLTHIVINIGMNISLLPVTGLPLPFVSAGGTFMLITLVAIGLLQNISLRRRSLNL
jgi:rod shape determining protein RodA